MNMTTVKGRIVKAVGFDDDSHKLYVKLNTGSVYVYEPVPATIYDDIISTSSPDTYYNKWINGQYNESRLT